MSGKALKDMGLILTASFLIFGIFVILNSHSANASADAPAYIEATLLTSEEAEQAVIVTAVDFKTAKQAILSVNGEVTSNLWLIDSAGGIVPTTAIELLATYPGVTSITSNKGVESANDPVYQWNGWVTDRRSYDGLHLELEAEDVQAPIVSLPDGGVLAIGEEEILIVNEDGSVRHERELEASSALQLSPVVDSENGIVYAANEYEIYAIRPDGNIEWDINRSHKLLGGLALGTNVLYAADEEQDVYGFDVDNGNELWSFSQNGSAGKFLAPPIVAQVGPYSSTMYIVSEKGHLSALNEGGVELWTTIAPSGEPFQLSPQVDGLGNIYIAANANRVYAVDPATGGIVYAYIVPDSIIGQPALASDGNLYVGTENGRIIGLNPDGSERFNVLPVSGAHIYTNLALANDETILFVTLKEKVLLAIDTVDGSLLWQHNTSGDLLVSPVVAPNGNVHIADGEGTYKILRAADGLLLYRYGGFDAFSRNPALSRQEGAIFFHEGEEDLIVLTRLSSEWDDSKPYVERTNKPHMYKVANPISIDMGADIAHLNGVTGAGITIAVVDSGVHFDKHTERTIGDGKKAQYLGQADFTGPGSCTATGPSPDPCFTGYESGPQWISSTDKFGHGSHVAGIIWNEVEDYYTGATLGMAPDANILSVRVLGDDGTGSYEDVIEGIQYVVTNTLNATFDVRIMNLSLSGYATSPYFVDPLNRAVEEAWAAGIVVLAAAGNNGPSAESITVPGNDPYVITVGSLNSNRTPGYWADDTLSTFSSTGPTRDGFIKPDILVPGGNVVSYMDNDATLAQMHPDYHIPVMRMFRMNGTSMATAVTSGVVALILEQYPTLTPDQVKFRLMYTARTAVQDGDFAYSPLRQGLGRIWVPDAVFDTIAPLAEANAGMDINDDLAHPWQPGDDPDPANNPDLAYHYQGPVQTILSDDEQIRLYYVEDENSDDLIALGASMHADGRWLNDDTVDTLNPTFQNGQTSWGSGTYLWSGGTYLWSGGTYLWSGGTYLWSGGTYLWSGGTYLWSGGTYLWSGGTYLWSGGTYLWSGGIDPTTTEATTTSWEVDVTCESAAIPVNKSLKASNGDVTLLWAEHPLNSNGYELHRNAVPYFVPNDDTRQTTIASEGITLYSDVDVANMGDHHFYVIRSHNCDGSSLADSEMSGQFTFALTP